jgi:hypothetical protein
MALGDAEGDGMCSRRTAQRRAKLACDLGYWRLVHKFNRWLNCPECGTERTSAKCPNEKCGHKGRSRNRDGTTNTKEFCRPYTFEIDIEKFVKAEPPKYARHFCARTWKEHKAAAKRGEHPNLLPMRKPAQPVPPDDPAPAAPKPERANPAAETRQVPQHARLSRREVPKFVTLFDSLLVPKTVVDESNLSPPRPAPPRDNAWTRILEVLEKKVNPHSFETWLKPTRYWYEEGGVLFVRVPSVEFRHGSDKFADVIREAIAALGLDVKDVRFASNADDSKFVKMDPQAALDKACAMFSVSPEHGIEVLRISKKWPGHP